MARNFVKTSSHILENSVEVVTGTPMTFAAWFRTPALHAGGLVYVGTGIDLNQWALALTSGGQVRAVSVGSTVNLGTYTANTWHHAAATFPSDTDRIPWLDGTPGTPITGTSTPSGVTLTRLGMYRISGVDHFFNGDMADAAIWNVALTANEITALSKGASPLSVRPQNLVGYWPLWGDNSPELDLHPRNVLVTDFPMTVTGATKSTSHAPVERFSGRWRVQDLIAGGAGQTITATGISSGEVFGTTKLNQQVAASGIASGEAFGTAKLNLQVIASGIASAEAFGTAKANQQIAGTGLASAEAFGTASVSSGAATITCSGIESAEAFGTAKLNQQIAANGTASAEAFGTANVITAGSVTCTGIASAEAFGTAQLNQAIVGTGIASGEAFGTAAPRQQVVALGIASAEAFGTANIKQQVQAAEIVTAEAFGTASVQTAGTITCTGIQSAESFGATTLSLLGTITAQAIASAEAFGTATISGGSELVTTTGIRFTGKIPSTRFTGEIPVTRFTGTVTNA